MNFCARRYLSASAAARNAVKGPSAVSGSHEGKTILRKFIVEK